MINPFVSTHFLVCSHGTDFSKPEVVLLALLQVAKEVFDLFAKPHQLASCGCSDILHMALCDILGASKGHSVVTKCCN